MNRAMYFLKLALNTQPRRLRPDEDSLDRDSLKNTEDEAIFQFDFLEIHATNPSDIDSYFKRT